ncbi:hypothetical protein HPP92_012059 [Vanilla planifolia]|uniref:Uncharacterized protein n=1 Tax=Vanilla planifolia TaxID=51239 RepID=A0A835R1V1_VANPL|nr:hypothetical protein HPP92_012059 [Vanilla planifolia]
MAATKDNRLVQKHRMTEGRSSKGITGGKRRQVANSTYSYVFGSVPVPRPQFLLQLSGRMQNGAATPNLMVLGTGEVIEKRFQRLKKNSGIMLWSEEDEKLEDVDSGRYRTGYGMWQRGAVLVSVDVELEKGFDQDKRCKRRRVLP